jgi:preprotein translocase subunit SecY
MTCIYTSFDSMCPNLFAWRPLTAATRQAHISAGGFVLLTAICLTVTLGVGIYFLMRRQMSLPIENSRALFRELCRMHQLNSSQRSLMLNLASGLKLIDPSSLFVDSTLWKIPDQAANGKEKVLNKQDWDKLRSLQRVLFMPASVQTKIS